MKFSHAYLVAVLTATGYAHMIMRSPIPMGNPNNSPIDHSGSDFPCKNIFEPTSDAQINHIQIGVPQTLAFTGSAVHGGGSCQVSLTKELKPTKSTKWMVIKSIEGGCPANVAGNLPSDPNGNGASTFKFTVPAGIDPGTYTLAWTWVNNVGNREFYMNCARADITAPSRKRYEPAPVVRRQSSFPDMFVANLEGVPGRTCKIPDNTNAIFPHPGSDVERAATSGFANPTDCTGEDLGSDGAAPSSGSGSGSGTTSAAAAPSATTSNAAGNFAGGANPQTTSTTTAAAATTTAAAVTTPAAAPVTTTSAAAAAPTPTSGSGTSSGGPSTAGTACSAEGAWACAANGLSFQRCASGSWSVAIPMAAGMTCEPGTSADIKMKVTSPSARRRRSLRT